MTCWLGATVFPTVGNAFAAYGLQVGYPGLPGNDWYLPIQDPGTSDLASVQGADYRVVMAIVYPDDQTANAAHQQAHQAAMAAVGHPVATTTTMGRACFRVTAEACGAETWRWWRAPTAPW